MKFQVEFDGTLKDDIKLSDSQYDLRITDFVISNKPFSHRAKASELLIVMSGRGQLNHGKATFEISEGSMFFFHDGESYSVISEENNLSVTVIGFSYFFFYPFDEKTVSFFSIPYLKRKLQTSVPKQEFEHIKYLLAIIKEHSTSYTKYSRFNLITIINFILLNYMVILDEKSRYNSQKKLDNIVAYIYNNFFLQSFSVGKMANDLYISPTHLSRLFKNEFEVSVQKFVLNLRLEFAYDQLLGTKMSVKEVSSMTGFKSVSYFIKEFKNKYNITPKKLLINSEKANNQSSPEKT